MIGVELRATHTQTRMVNGDSLVSKVKNIIGGWKGGKFMPLSLRGHSANTYCLPKLWFKCGSIDLRAGDASKITSNVKSWFYADQLLKPEELVLYKNRKEGGLNMVNVKYRAMAELIKSFIDTAINPTFRRNLYHQALFNWHVEDVRSIPDPGKPAYYSAEFFNAIKEVKTEGLLKLSMMTTGTWYKVLLENNVTRESDENGFSFKIRSKSEQQTPNINWEQVWAISSLPGLDSSDTSFIFCLLHNLLPTQERLHRVLQKKVTSNHCVLCPQEVPCDQLHALVYCPYNQGISLWLIRCLRELLPHLQPKQLLHFNFGLDGNDKNALPVAWFSVKVLQQVWLARTQKKHTTLLATRAALEANVMLLRKTRFKSIATIVEDLFANI